ncbi:MAG: flagellar hook-associated protein FlgL [Lachnospiraceae bacterium]|nr:flagellar hook-associated protein FlgL [Lachnospiraceae bacterium]
MRITNKMMTNNMLHNINTNKTNMTNLENKYASGMAIQKPSDDPIVAVRALKLRTNLSELNQYYEKNIPDAMSWMDVTESALHTTSELITQIHTYCDQGANDTLAVSERDSIAKNLVALKEQIYSEGNSNYAGRFVFAGYKTSTPLVFETPETQTEYTITEDIDASAIDISEKVINGYDPADIQSLTAATAGSLAAATPEKNTIYRIRLSYDDLKAGGDVTLKIPKLDSKGNYELDPVTGERQYEDEIDKSGMTVTASSDLNAYNPGDDEIVFLEDTGEIILGKNKYEEWRNSKFEVTYDKDSFEKNELRPEHYFTCTAKDLTITDPAERDAKAVNYTVEDQQIAYEVNFNQRLAINVQGRDAFRHSLGRSVDDIVKAIEDVDAVNNSIATVDKLLEDTTLTDAQKTSLTDIKKTLDEERKMKEAVLRKAFGSGLTAMDNEENTVNAATSDIGTRYRRLELTQDRLATQQVEFTDLLSQNEDADLVDTIVNYNAANTVYNASLQAAGKVVKNSLLDFL